MHGQKEACFVHEAHKENAIHSSMQQYADMQIEEGPQQGASQEQKSYTKEQRRADSLIQSVGYRGSSPTSSGLSLRRSIIGKLDSTEQVIFSPRSDGERRLSEFDIKGNLRSVELDEKKSSCQRDSLRPHGTERGRASNQHALRYMSQCRRSHQDNQQRLSLRNIVTGQA